MDDLKHKKAVVNATNCRKTPAGLEGVFLQFALYFVYFTIVKEVIIIDFNTTLHITKIKFFTCIFW